MGSKPRAKMPQAERAKQFMPFAALKGLPEALAAKEKVKTAKIEPSEDMAEELDRTLRRLKVGQRLTVVYFNDDEYRSLTAPLEKLDQTAKTLSVGGEMIPIADILSLSAE